MRQRPLSLRMYLHPVLFAAAAIILGAIVAVGASHIEGGILNKALQSMASIPGMNWVAKWITPTDDPSIQTNSTDSIPLNRISESIDNENVLLAGGSQSGQAISLLQSANLLTPTPLPGAISTQPTTTGTSPEVSVTTTALSEESPTTTPVEDTTPSPSGTVQGTLTPTATELPGTRHLSLSSVEVKPGEKFQVDLYCDNNEGVAGIDIGLMFEPNMLDLVTVHKTGITDPFLLVKRKEPGSFVLSLAGLDGLEVGSGVLLTFEGMAADSTTQEKVAVVSFIKAKLYDTESKAFEVRTSSGMIRIRPQPTQKATEIVRTTTTPEEASTPPSETSLDEEPTPLPETASAVPSTGSAIPPVSLGGGYLTGPIPVISPTVTPLLQPTPPASVSSLEATPSPTRLRADLNKDGEVNSLDLMEFMRNWQLVFPSQ